MWNYKVIHDPLSLILLNFLSAFEAACDLRQYSHRIMSHVFSPLTWGEVIKKAGDRDYTLIPTVQSGLWTSPCIDLGECHTLMKTTKLFTVIPWCFTALVACCDSIHLIYIYKTKEMNQVWAINPSVYNSSASRRGQWIVNHFNLGFAELGEVVHGHRAVTNIKHAWVFLHMYIISIENAD